MRFTTFLLILICFALALGLGVWMGYQVGYVMASDDLRHRPEHHREKLRTRSTLWVAERLGLTNATILPPVSDPALSRLKDIQTTLEEVQDNVQALARDVKGLAGDAATRKQVDAGIEDLGQVVGSIYRLLSEPASAEEGGRVRDIK